MSCPPGSYGELFKIGSPVVKMFCELLKKFYETNHIEDIFKALLAKFNTEYSSIEQCADSSTPRYLPTCISTLDKCLFFKETNTLAVASFNNAPYFCSSLGNKILKTSTKKLSENKLDEAITILQFGIDDMCEQGFDLDKAHLLIQLAEVYTQKDMFSDADRSLLEARVIQEQHLGQTHVECINTIKRQSECFIRKANSLLQHDKFKDAFQSYHKARTYCFISYGSDSDEMATIYLKIAKIERVRGEYRSSFMHCNGCLEICKHAETKNELKIADALTHKAQLIADEGQYETAEEILLSVLTTRTQMQAPSSPDITSTLDKLGKVCLSQNKLEAAKEYNKRALELKEHWQERQVSNSNVDIAESLNNLGNVYRALKNYTKAKVYNERALDMQKKLIGIEKLQTADTLVSLGATCLALNKFDEAAEYCEKALTIKVTLLHDKHPDIALILHHLGEICREKCQYGKAHEHHTQAFDIQIKYFDKKHPSVRTSMNYLGTVSTNQHKFETADEYYHCAIDGYETLSNNKTENTTNVLCNLAYLYAIQCKYKKAKDYYKQALRMQIQLFGEHDVRVGNTTNSLADLFKELNRFDEAERYYTRALSIYQRTYNGDHMDIANVLNKSGQYI